jgi:hypothetical protein
MKKIIFTGVTLLLIIGCNRKDQDDESGAGTGPEKASRVSRSANGESTVALDEPVQKEIGLKAEPVMAVRISPELKGYGQVIDPAALASMAGDFTSARVASETSQTDLKRLKLLAAQDNASARALQAAEVAAARDGAQFESARSKLVASWGAAVVERADSAEFLRSLESGESALVRVDLPAGEVPGSPPAQARLVTLGGEQVAAGFLGVAPAVDPRTQSQGYLFLVTSNAARLAPGAAVTAFLQTAGDPQSGFVIRDSSVIHHAGATWVYLQTNGTNFIRREVGLDRPLTDGWFVRRGVEEGDQVVVTGAQTVFSEELKASGFLSGERD